MKNILIYSFLFIIIIVPISLAYIEPPYLEITKPIPTTIKTICSIGCDYSTISDADSSCPNLVKPVKFQIKAGVYKFSQWDCSGTENNEVVIEAYGDGQVYIEISGEGNNWNIYGDYVIIDGGENREITIRKKAGTTYLSSLLRLRGDHQTFSRLILQGPIGECSSKMGSTNTLIAPNHQAIDKPSNYRIYNNILDSHSHKGIYVAGTINGEIKNNIIRNGEATAIQINPHNEKSYVEGIEISGNIITDSIGCTEGGHGIYIQGDADEAGTISGVMISNNIISEMTRSGIRLYSDSATLVGNEYIYHNTLYNNDEWGIDIQSGNTGSKVFVKNNIIYDNNDGELNDDGEPIINENNIINNPNFLSTNLQSDDYLKLSKNSDAIDVGNNINIELDLDGNLRPSGDGYDAGAYEFNEGIDLDVLIQPPVINIKKPTSILTKTVCANNCDYTTLEQADQEAQPGWKIQIKAESYDCISWNSNGEFGNEIIIEPFGDGDVIFNCEGQSRFRIFGTNTIFDGGNDYKLIFDGTNLDTSERIIYPQVESDYITFYRVIIRNNKQGSNMNIMGDNFRIFNSYIYGANSVGIYGSEGNNHQIRNNIIFNNNGTGIQYNPHETGLSCDNITIAGNLIYNNGYGGPAGDRPGISLLSSADELYEVIVYNNMIFNNKVCGIKLNEDSYNADLKVYHNTLYNNKDAGMILNNDGTAVAKNNIVYKNGNSDWANWPNGNNYYDPLDSEIQNNIIENPDFISTNFKSTNFLKISSTSIAINTGANLGGLFNIDFFGTIRPQGNEYDAGAYEYEENSGNNCIHESEIEPCDNDVSSIELFAYVEKWIDGDVSITDVMQAINLWKN
jgi:parallel beta-helix repeat protein